MVYISSSCLGLYFLKAAEGWKTPLFATGLLLYGSGAVLWLFILRLLPLSFAFPVASGCLMIGTLLSGAILLGESVSAGHIVGSCMIIGGITIIALNR